MELRQFRKIQLICCYLLSLAQESLGYDIDFEIDQNCTNYSILNDELKNVKLGTFKTDKLIDEKRVFCDPDNGYFIQKNGRNIEIKSLSHELVLCTVHDFGPLDGNRNTQYNATCKTSIDNGGDDTIVIIKATVVTGELSPLDIGLIIAAFIAVAALAFVAAIYYQQRMIKWFRKMLNRRVPSFEDVDKNRDGKISEDEYDEIFQTHGLTIGK